MTITAIYWASTVLSAIALLLSAISYFAHGPTIVGFSQLGFPDFFRVELGVLQLLAAAVLLVPLPYPHVKEWAYAGSAIFYVTAIVAHIAHRDSHLITIANALLLAVLFISNHYMHRLQTL
jgi:hypothetical protein